MSKDPNALGRLYDKIATWWYDRHLDSNYGVTQFNHALNFVPPEGNALDVGCGAGGRFINILNKRNYQVTGIDVSSNMITVAKQNHPEHSFHQQNICTWIPDKKYDFIYAWDSLFHLPLDQHQPVLNRLCDCLSESGVMMFTLGDAEGEHEDQWHNESFYCSSIGINKTLEILLAQGLKIKHVDIDQYPEKHVVIIAQKITK